MICITIHQLTHDGSVLPAHQGQFEVQCCSTTRGFEKYKEMKVNWRFYVQLLRHTDEKKIFECF